MQRQVHHLHCLQSIAHENHVSQFVLFSFWSYQFRVLFCVLDPQILSRSGKEGSEMDSMIQEEPVKPVSELWTIKYSNYETITEFISDQIQHIIFICKYFFSAL